jgi:hypothetical protein
MPVSLLEVFMRKTSPRLLFATKTSPNSFRQMPRY